MENPPMLFMGKSTISLAMASIAILTSPEGMETPRKTRCYQGTTTCSD